MTARRNSDVVGRVRGIALGMVLAMVPIGSRDAAAAPPTVQQIIEGIERALGDIRCLETRVTMTATMLNDAVQDDQVLVDGGFFWQLDEYAWSDGGRKQLRVQKYFTPATLEEFTERRPSIWVQAWAVFDGERYFRNRTEKKPGEEAETVVATIEPANTTNPINFHYGNIYHECIGSLFYDGKDLDVWNLREADDVEEMALYAFSLPTALRNRSYVLSPRMETVNGVECWLLEADSQDRLWLAPEYGFAVVQREWRYGPGRPLKFRYVNSDFREAATGFWLPHRAQRFIMARPGYAPAHANTSHFVVQCDVTEVRVNNPPDDLFVMYFAPGARVVDVATDKEGVLTYAAGATPEATERALERAIKLKRDSAKQSALRGTIWMLLIGLNLAAAAALAILIYYRRRRSRE